MRFSPKLARFQGEYAEACFIAKAMSKGLRISKPFGDSVPYDFITQSGRRLLRVQVKSVGTKYNNVYRLAVVRHRLRGKLTYSKREIDFLAEFVIPENAWYIIPASEIRSDAAFCLFPHRPPRKPNSGRFEKFREAWHHLQ